MPLFLLEDENEEEELSVAKSPSIINATNLWSTGGSRSVLGDLTADIAHDDSQQ
jgi:hypothetical protein